MSAVAKLWTKKMSELLVSGASREDALGHVPAKWREEVEELLNDTGTDISNGETHE